MIEASPDMHMESEKEWYYGNADKERLGPYSYDEVGSLNKVLGQDRVSSVMEKSWKSGKWQNHFPDLEKSWNLKKRPKSWKNHGISKCIDHGKIMEFCF